jgi:iron complex transport system substrate-binding protein
MKAPKRIVSLISSATEILYLLGLGERVVGVSHECDYPLDVAGKPRLTRSLVEAAAASRAIDEEVRLLSAEQSALYAIDVEGLAALEPDLIITQAQCDVCAVRYEDVVAAVRETPVLHGTPVLALNPSRLADVLDDIVRVGEATGVVAVAREAVARLTARIEQVRSRSGELAAEKRPRVTCLEWIDPPMLAANWTPELVTMAGGEPGLVVAGQHSGYADWAEILRYDPEIVVIMPCGFDLARAIVESQVLPGVAGWMQLSAVREGRVFAVDGNAYFNRSGPRLVESLEILAHLFHGELFEPPAIEPRAWQRLATRGAAMVGDDA